MNLKRVCKLFFEKNRSVISVILLYNQRAEYGKQIVKNLSVKLTNKYGSGWSYESLKHCLRVANIFTEEEIGYAVRIQFSWTYICFDRLPKNNLLNKN